MSSVEETCQRESESSGSCIQMFFSPLITAEVTHRCMALSMFLQADSLTLTFLTSLHHKPASIFLKLLAFSRRGLGNDLSPEQLMYNAHPRLLVNTVSKYRGFGLLIQFCVDICAEKQNLLLYENIH